MKNAIVTSIIAAMSTFAKALIKCQSRLAIMIKSSVLNVLLISNSVQDSFCFNFFVAGFAVAGEVAVQI